MNHYEELGVGCDGSTEEIRQAYKALARLLHPDGQTDPKLKSMAERQMQRLNGILELLTDPELRREYDEGLPELRVEVAPAVVIPRGAGRRPDRRFPRGSPGRTPSGPRPVVARGSGWVQTVAQYWFWVLLGTTAAVTVAVWWAVPPERSVTEAPPVREGIAPRDEPKRNKSVPAKRMAREEHYPPRSFVDPAPRSQEARPAFPDPVIPPAVKRQAPVRPGELTQPQPVELERKVDRTSGESRFAGNWLYTPQAGETADPSAYPAVYVEFLLAEDNGDLVGTYRAKYKVLDKAISPEVLLRIRGRASAGRSVSAGWSSGDGAKGVLEMTLTSPGLMSVAWWTTEFGRQLQLTSGSAVLVRQQAP
jgi:hypothetical protein